MFKKIFIFILTQITDHDRLSVISFDNRVYGVFGLQQCTPRLIDEVMNSQYLRPGGGTNIKAGLMQGLSVLRNRKQNNPITSMILLTDGNGVIPNDTELEQINTEVHCFGVGVDHDAHILAKISELSHGSYVFIETPSTIGESMATCLGGLLSITAQNIKIIIQSGCKILDVKTSYPVQFTDHSATIIIPNLLAEEHKEILFTLEVPSTDEVQNSLLFVTSLEYTNIRGEIKSSEIQTSILRNRGSQIVNLEIDRERNRVRGADSLKRAIELGESGQLSQARDLLTQTIEALSLSATANDPLIIEIKNDLKLCRDRFQNRDVYDTLGFAWAQQQHRSHSSQRSINSSIYLNSTQSDILTQSNSYLQHNN